MGYSGFLTLTPGSRFVPQKESGARMSFRDKGAAAPSNIHFYSLFHGVEMVRWDIEGDRAGAIEAKGKKVMQIDHCHMGRAEYAMADGCMTYLGEGDLFLSMRENYKEEFRLPLNRYLGVSFLFDLEWAASSVEAAMPDYPICFEGLREKFLSDDECFTIHARGETAAIMNRLYDAPERARMALAKLTVLELLIGLSLFDTSCERHYSTFAIQQVEIAKAVHEMLTQDLSRRYTIEELAEAQSVSLTALKKYFRGVYGKPVASYMKEYRMTKAADYLRHTDMSVAEVAAAVGYESQSKFTETFRNHTSTTPMECRRRANQ